MGDRNELHLKVRAETIPLPRLDDPEVSQLRIAVVFDLRPRVRNGKFRSIDRNRCDPFQLVQDERDPTDVILVPMGEEDGAELI